MLRSSQDIVSSISNQLLSLLATPDFRKEINEYTRPKIKLNNNTKPNPRPNVNQTPYSQPFLHDKDLIPPTRKWYQQLMKRLQVQYVLLGCNLGEMRAIWIDRYKLTQESFLSLAYNLLAALFEPFS